MSNCLIDENGSVWPADSPQLRRRLWASQPAPVLCQYAVTNLGFAQLSLSPRAIIIRWRPTSISKETLVGLVQALMDQADGRVSISTLRMDWAESICGSIEQARAALLREFETARCERGGYFRAVPRHPDTLAAGSPLGRVLGASLQANGVFDPVSLWQMLEHSAGGRYILTEAQGDHGPLRIVAWGSGYQSMTSRWIADAPGKNFEDQPDAAYAKGSIKSYRSAIARGVSIVEDVDASTWWPGRGRSRIRYSRLILPLTLESGRRLVLSTAQPSDIS